MTETSTGGNGIYRFLRINREAVPSVPPCSVHRSMTGKEAEDVFVIHKDGDKANVQYFCATCQRQLLERLLRDYMNFPGLKPKMGAIIIPAADADKIQTGG